MFVRYYQLAFLDLAFGLALDWKSQFSQTFSGAEHTYRLVSTFLAFSFVILSTCVVIGVWLTLR